MTRAASAARIRDADSSIASGLIEGRLSVAIPPHTLQPDDFETIDYIVETVLRVAQP